MKTNKRNKRSAGDTSQDIGAKAIVDETSQLILNKPELNSASGKVWTWKISNDCLGGIPRGMSESLDLQQGDILEAVSLEGGILLVPTKNRPKAYKKLFRLAVRILKDKAEATAWLHKPQYGLGGIRPIDFMRTTKGAETVEDLLLQIEHGVYA